MAWTRNAWNNFKTQPEIWFFYAFLATSMLSVRKVVSDVFIGGEFNEYTGTYLYLSDIFLILAIAIWAFIILYNKLHNLSIRTSTTLPLPLGSKLFDVEQFRFLRRGTLSAIFIPLILVAWSFLSVIWSENASIALYRSFKLFEFYLLFLFLGLNPKCSTNTKRFAGQHPEKTGLDFLRNAFRIIIAIGLINGLIGISQVMLQHSLGLFWLKESLISPDLPGVAKIVLGGTKYIRAYGLFPHPNILGGFLMLSIILTFSYRYLFPADEKMSPNNLAPSSTWNLLFKITHHPNFLPILILAQIVAGILTFSKSAILGLILALVYIFRHGKVKMFHVEHFDFVNREALKKAFLLAIIIGLGLYLIHPDFGSIFIKSLIERLVYIKISLNMISGNFLTGIGSGQFILEMQKYLNQVLLPWQFQPVHNVFLLIWSELGLVGLGLFIWLLRKMFRVEQLVIGSSINVPRETIENRLNLQSVFVALIIGFFAIALFDHYLWDIQQGQIMLWVVLGLLAGMKSNT